jgi:hypothetical protein
MDALGECPPELSDRLLHAADDVLRVLPLEHDDHARDHLALAVSGDGALPRLGADGDLRHVAQVELLPPADDDAAPRVRVAALDRSSSWRASR